MWHTDKPAAQEALKEMANTHRVVYLEAHDMHGRLIEPCLYRRYLQGTLVQVYFAMIHWSTRSEKRKETRLRHLCI